MKHAMWMLLLAAGAFAGETTDVKLYDVVLYPPNGGAVVHFKTMEECVAAAPAAVAPGAKSRCHVINYVTKVVECDKEPPPFPVQVDPDGFVVKPALRIPTKPDGTWLPAEIQAMVPGPGYPDCWVTGWVPYTGQDNQGGDDPPTAMNEQFAPEPLRCNAPGADLGNCIDPEYRESCGEEHADPVRCTSTGPGPGPEGAETVDKPS